MSVADQSGPATSQSRGAPVVEGSAVALINMPASRQRRKEATIVSLRVTSGAPGTELAELAGRVVLEATGLGANAKVAAEPLGHARRVVDLTGAGGRCRLVVHEEPYLLVQRPRGVRAPGATLLTVDIVGQASTPILAFWSPVGVIFQDVSIVLRCHDLNGGGCRSEVGPGSFAGGHPVAAPTHSFLPRCLLVARMAMVGVMFLSGPRRLCLVGNVPFLLADDNVHWQWLGPFD